MARPKSSTLTEGEQRIMEVLWKLGEASVQQVTDALAASDPIAYTTSLTMLRILHEKGYVECHKEAKAYVYVPAVTRDNVRSTALKQLLRRFFDDSPEALAQHLVRDTQIDLHELDRLNRQVTEVRKTRKRK
jgi:BlaI family penicillinase repressor